MKSTAVAASASVVLGPAAAWAQDPIAEPDWPDRFFYGPGMMGWGGGWYGPLIMIIALVAVVVVAVLLVRWLGGPWQSPGQSQPGTPTRTPLDTLKERFARGEIDKEEFEERRRILGD